MLKYLIAAVALLAVAGGLAYWVYGPGDDSAEAEVQVIRWVNVTVEVPEDSGVAASTVYAGASLPIGSGLLATRTFDGTESGPRPVLVIESEDRLGSGVAIDAETGQITRDTVLPDDRAAIDQVLQSVTVSPLDTSTLPWPYNGQPPNVTREKSGNITYILADPAAGIMIIWGIADPGGIEFIEVNNGRSLVFIVTDTGSAVWEPDFLVPEDKEVLERFLGTVQYVGP